MPDDPSSSSKKTKTLQAPVLFLVFNRPELTRQVFEAIRRAKPAQLFVAADGPRKDRLAENEICKLVREIATNADWECDVKTLFRNENMGCGKAVSEAITWFFEHVDEGIILEDDCLCDQTFFTYAADLLALYRSDEKIMHIGGYMPVNSVRMSTDFSFVKYPLVWGWATWRRAWNNYDYNITDWPNNGKRILKNVFLKDKEIIKYWSYIFTETFNHRIDTWDYQWVYACFKQNCLSIIPQKNMIENIGFGSAATHTKDPNDKRSNHTLMQTHFPISIPQRVELNIELNKILEAETIVLDYPKHKGVYEYSSILVKKILNRLSLRKYERNKGKVL